MKGPCCQKLDMTMTPMPSPLVPGCQQRIQQCMAAANCSQRKCSVDHSLGDTMEVSPRMSDQRWCRGYCQDQGPSPKAPAQAHQASQGTVGYSSAVDHPGSDESSSPQRYWDVKGNVSQCVRRPSSGLCGSQAWLPQEDPRVRDRLVCASLLVETERQRRSCRHCQFEC